MDFENILPSFQLNCAVHFFKLGILSTEKKQTYSRRSRKRPPRKFKIVFITRAGCSRNRPYGKTMKNVAQGSFRSSLILHKENDNRNLREPLFFILKLNFKSNFLNQNDPKSTYYPRMS